MGIAMSEIFNKFPKIEWKDKKKEKLEKIEDMLEKHEEEVEQLRAVINDEEKWMLKHCDKDKQQNG